MTLEELVERLSERRYDMRGIGFLNSPPILLIGEEHCISQRIEWHLQN